MGPEGSRFIALFKRDGVVAFALVDAEDFDELNRHRWRLKSPRGGRRTRYAWRRCPEQGYLSMHRVLLDAPAVDHVNLCGLDNRRSNLRPATTTENNRNVGRRRDNSSGFKGVSKHGRRWVARISHDGRNLNIGSFTSPEAASQAYRDAAQRLHGEYARFE